MSESRPRRCSRSQACWWSARSSSASSWNGWFSRTLADCSSSPTRVGAPSRGTVSLCDREIAGTSGSLAGCGSTGDGACTPVPLARALFWPCSPRASTTTIRIAPMLRAKRPPRMRIFTTSAPFMIGEPQGGTSPALWSPWRLVQMDRHFGAHPRHEILPSSAIERDEHRNALADFGEIPTGIVLGRQERELASSGLHDLLHMPTQAGATVSIDRDIHALAIRDVVDGSFSDIGDDADPAQIGHLHDGESRRDSLASDGRNLYDGATDWTGNIDCSWRSST